MKNPRILYWISTSFVILIAGVGSIADLIPHEQIVATTTAIVFPLYVLPLFGTLKILGTAAITIPYFARFREAGYAGLIYYFVGALYCHLAVGDGMDKLVAPIFVLLMLVLSYLSSLRLSKRDAGNAGQG